MEGSFVGFVQLDGTFSGILQVVDSSRTPTDSDAFPTFRVYSQNVFLEDGTCSYLHTGNVTNATNASPIVITSTDHKLSTGARITITGTLGNTAANGTFLVTKVDDNTFSLDGSTGSGAYTSGGVWHKTGLYAYSVSALGADGYEAGEVFSVLFDFAISAVQKGASHRVLCT